LEARGGALIVEGMDQAVPQVRGLREQVLVIRDQDLMHPQAIRCDQMRCHPPIVLRDAEGDILNGDSMEAACQGFERELRTRAVSGLFPGDTPGSCRRVAILAGAERFGDHLRGFAVVV